MTPTKHEPDYGVPKEKLPAEWVEAREKMENEIFGARFHVEKWYFRYLVLAALLLLGAAFIYRSLGIAAAAAALTALLYTWNNRAYRAAKADSDVVDVSAKSETPTEEL